MKILTPFLILLFSFATLSSDERQNPYQSTLLNGDPDLFVNGVHVITGDYFENNQYLHVIGAEPIHLSMSYTTQGRNSLDGGWINFPHLRSFHNVQANELIVSEPNGLKLSYSIPQEKGPLELCVNEHALQSGMTNTSSGQVSAHLNLKNNRIFFEEDRKSFTLTTASGIKRYYEIQTHLNEYHEFPVVGKVRYRETFFLKKEQLANGNVVRYSYTDHGKISKVETLNPLETKVYAWISFRYIQEPPTASAITSDNQEFHFECETVIRNRKPISRLKWALGTKTPKQTFIYDNNNDGANGAISEKQEPQGRKTRLNYYIDPNKPFFMRVKQVGTPHTRFNFKYFSGIPYETPGYTQVFDGEGNLTVYKYSPEMRIKEIEYYEGNSKLKKVEKLFWGENEGLEATFLQARILLDAEKRPFFAKRFFYDLKGNPIEESVYGNFTGRTDSTFLLDENGFPLDFSTETLSINRVYSQDNRNLLLREIYPNGLETYYEYHPLYELITAKFELDKGQIKKRQFFVYNEDLILVRTITDNGSGSSEEDLTNVSHRLINAITPKLEQPALNLPKTITEKYLDLKTGQEKQLKRTVLSYNKQAQPIREDVYDANDVFRYRIEKEYDKHGNLIYNTNPIGQRSSFSYDENFNLIFLKEEALPTFDEFEYDLENRIIAKTTKNDLGYARTTRYNYNRLGQRSSIIDEQQNQASYLYDIFGNCIEEKKPAAIDEFGYLLPIAPHYKYDLFGNVTESINAKQEILRASYNAFRKPICIIHENGAKTLHSYDKNGILIQTTQEDGGIIKYDHDVFGNITYQAVFSPDMTKLKEEYWEYDGFHILSYTDPAKVQTVYSYDGAGRKTKEQTNSHEGVYTKEFFYDPLGNLSCIKTYADDIHYLSVFSKYDLLGRVIETWEEDTAGEISSRITYEYDEFGNKHRITRHLSESIAIDTFSYDEKQRLTSHTDPLGYSTYFEYNDFHKNEAGQFVLQKRTTDPLNNVTVETFNTQAQLTAVTKLNKEEVVVLEELYSYDRLGNQTVQKNHIYKEGDLQSIYTIRWVYEYLDKVSTLIEAANSNNPKFTYYHHDMRGRRRNHTKPDGSSINTTYDALDRPIEVISNDGLIYYEYIYNEAGDLVEVKDHIHGANILRDHDSMHRVISETFANTHIVQRSYDLLGRCTSVVLPDDSSITYTYDTKNLKKITRYNPNAEEQYSHLFNEYDSMGQCLEESMILDLGNIHRSVDIMERVVQQITPFSSHGILEFDPLGMVRKTYSQELGEISFEYDALNQLEEEKGPFTHTYCNDSHHNLHSVNDTHFEIDSFNQITSHYEYNLSGNPTLKKGKFSCEYDALGRLVQVTLLNGVRYQYVYDAFNRRVFKHIINEESLLCCGSDAEQTETYIYIDQDELAMIKEAKINQARIPKLDGSQGIVAIELDNIAYAAIEDLQANVSYLISKSQEAYETYFYSAYTEENSEVSKNPWRYQGKRNDPETGLIYFQQRYYDPETARWLTPDPAGFVETTNLYAYVLNSPINRRDLYGLMSTDGSKGTVSENILAATGGLGLNYLYWLISGTDYNPLGLPNPEIIQLSQGTSNRTDICAFGILTRKEESLSYAETLLQNCPAYKSEKNAPSLFLITNPTHGPLDLIRAGLKKIGLPSQLTWKLQAILESQLKAGKHVTIHAFSEASIDTRNLVTHLDQKHRALFKERVDIVTYGSAAMIEKGLARRAINVVSNNDGVAWICSYPQMRTSQLGVSLEKSNFNIINVPTQSYFPVDHRFMDVYFNKMNEIISKANPQ